MQYPPWKPPAREERSGLNLVTRQWAPGSMSLRRSIFSPEAAILAAPSPNANAGQAPGLRGGF